MTSSFLAIGPSMPSREVTLSAVSQGPPGTDPDAVQRFTITSGSLVTNDGRPVPDGTRYTVRSLVPGSSVLSDYGTILTADEDPAREEVQVSSLNGVLRFAVEYLAPGGAYIPGRAVVYSTVGTAFGQLVVTP